MPSVEGYGRTHEFLFFYLFFFFKKRLGGERTDGDWLLQNRGTNSVCVFGLHINCTINGWMLTSLGAAAMLPSQWQPVTNVEVFFPSPIKAWPCKFSSLPDQMPEVGYLKQTRCVSDTWCWFRGGRGLRLPASAEWKLQLWLSDKKMWFSCS